MNNGPHLSQHAQGPEMCRPPVQIARVLGITMCFSFSAFLGSILIRGSPVPVMTQEQGGA